MTNAFIGSAKQPTEAELSQALGAVKPVWDQLIADLADQYGAGIQEWKAYSAKSGWSLRLKRKKRTIVHLAPGQACFQVAFILGDKAVEAAHQNKLPKRVIQLLDQAPRYPEGTGLRLEIDSPRDIAAVKLLAAIKLAN